MKNTIFGCGLLALVTYFAVRCQMRKKRPVCRWLTINSFRWQAL